MNLWAKQKGFTIVELLIVIVVIAILAAITIVAYNGVQARAHDSKREADGNGIKKALEVYRVANNRYPLTAYTGGGSVGGWESSHNEDPGEFIADLKNYGYASGTPVDPTNSVSNEYRYYRYPAGYAGCDASRGPFFVFGIRDMEATSGAASSSPGWNCPSRNWQTEFEWVTGGFES